MDAELVRSDEGNAAERELPPILVGSHTPTVARKVESFANAVAEMFDRWVARCESPHTQRSYRQDVLAFVGFMKFPWPKNASNLLTVRVADVQGYRDSLTQAGMAPK